MPAARASNLRSNRSAHLGLCSTLQLCYRTARQILVYEFFVKFYVIWMRAKVMKGANDPIVGESIPFFARHYFTVESLTSKIANLRKNVMPL